MRYINYIGEIYHKLDTYYYTEQWKHKCVVLFGFSVLGQIIASYFDDHKVENFYIVDNKKAGMIWIDQYILKPGDVLPNIPSDSIILIAPRNKSIHEEILSFNKKLESAIVDLSYYTSDYLSDEFRNDMKIPELKKASLTECHNEFIPLLQDFHDFCCEHNLTYYLEFGTLLGAIRHKGFIPWDDDVDVSMPIKDYLKFCKLYATEGKYHFESIYNLKSIPLSSVAKIKSSDIVTEYIHFPVVSITGICIDINPICGFPSNVNEQMAFMQEFYRIGDIWKHDAVITHGENTYNVEKCSNVQNEMTDLLLKYNYDTAEYVGPVYFLYVFGNDVPNHAVKKEWYNERILVPFEGKKFYAPGGYDELLKHWYNDYMELPPIEKRVSLNTGKIYRYEGEKEFYLV